MFSSKMTTTCLIGVAVCTGGFGFGWPGCHQPESPAQAVPDATVTVSTMATAAVALAASLAFRLQVRGLRLKVCCLPTSNSVDRDCFTDRAPDHHRRVAGTGTLGKGRCSCEQCPPEMV